MSLVVCACVAAISAAQLTFDVTPTRLEEFLGAKSGVLVYTQEEEVNDSAAATTIYFIRSNDSPPLAAQRVCEGDFPKVSPDGCLVHIRCTGDFCVRVFDLRGSVLETHTGHGRASYRIDRSTLGPGFRFVELVTPDGTLRRLLPWF